MADCPIPSLSQRRRKAQGDREPVSPILHFRNRIAHHEAIFSSGLERQHGRILELARTIDAEAEQHILDRSRVGNLLREKPH